MGDHSQDIIDGMVKSVLAQSIEHVVAYEIKHKNKLRKLTASKENEPALKFKYLPLSNAILKNKWSSILPNIRRSTFKRAIKKHKKQTVRGKIGRTFDKLDLNLDGHLTVAEIKRALTLNSTSLNLSQFPILSQIFRPRYLSWAFGSKENVGENTPVQWQFNGYFVGSLSGLSYGESDERRLPW